MRRTRTLPLAAIAAATLALSACGGGSAGGGGGYDSSGGYGAPPPAPAASAPAPAGPAGGAADGLPALNATEAASLGTIVSDAGGFTLYRFEKDSAKPPKTTCVGECATKWPPVVVDPTGTLSLDGVDKSKVGMVQRPDGTSQLTIGGWPVYRFAGDAEPGEAKGQGVGKTWFAITPDGKKAEG